MTLTALIPVHNDDYALSLCLASVVPHFDRVVVFDDASTDATPQVIAHYERGHDHVHAFRGETILGWVEARNALLSCISEAGWQMDPLFWLDSDDVLCEYNAGLLAEIAAGYRPVVRLQICELWGDLNHTTGRLHHYDRCHTYVNARLAADMIWKGGTVAKPVGPERGDGSWHAARSGGPLLFHIKGVKPDQKHVERTLYRRWLRRRNRSAAPATVPTPSTETFTPEELHRRALKRILHSRQDRLHHAYGIGADWPRRDRAPIRPHVIEEECRRGQRFEIVYRDGKPVDRIDHGWACPVDTTPAR